jgi:hypothetical protein
MREHQKNMKRERVKNEVPFHEKVSRFQTISHFVSSESVRAPALYEGDGQTEKKVRR